MSEVPATSFQVLNYSGMLYNKGNTNVPFLSMLSARARRATRSVEFVIGQEYQTNGGSQPAISETASLTAPDASVYTRSQLTNVTQIFQESVYVSYGKMSNPYTLAGVNLGGQEPNPIDEMDFQTAAKIQKVQRDLEFTLLRGTYNKATTDSTINKTRGLLTAITTNVISGGGAALRVWDLADMMKLVYEANAPTSGLVAWLDPVAMYQINADAEQNSLKIQDNAVVMGGITMRQLMTPLGAVSLRLGEFMPAGTVMLFNPQVLNIVEQPVPGKGNFFLEELAKTGAGTKYQLFGQIGMDHGPEWMHAKITGLATTFTKPPVGQSVYIMNSAVPTVSSTPVLIVVTLSGTAVDDVATDALALEWVGATPSSPTLAYQWQIADTLTGEYAAISGGTSATYKPVTANVGKYIRCRVTATGTGSGTAYSNALLVAAE